MSEQDDTPSQIASMAKSGKDFLLLQELPDFEEAVRRAEASLAAGGGGDANECRCPHLRALLPTQLDLQWIPHRNGTGNHTASTEQWMLQDPISALHLHSQLESPEGGFVVTSESDEPPVLYGEEQERWMAARTQGFADTWHPWVEQSSDTTAMEHSSSGRDAPAVVPLMGLPGPTLPPGLPLWGHTGMTAPPDSNALLSGSDISSQTSPLPPPQAIPMNTMAPLHAPPTFHPTMAHSLPLAMGPAPVVAGAPLNTTGVSAPTGVTAAPAMMPVMPWSMAQHQLAQMEWKSLSYQAAQDQIVHVRREFLSKRPSALDKKRQLDQLKAAAAAATVTDKRRKSDLPSLVQTPAWRQYAPRPLDVAQLTPDEQTDWLERRRRAVALVEVWMEQFRQCYVSYWRDQRSSQDTTAPVKPSAPKGRSVSSLRTELSPTSVFGAAETARDDVDRATPPRSCQVCTAPGTKDQFQRDAWFSIGGCASTHNSLKGDDLMQCLECSFTGCSPVSVCSQRDATRQHIVQHFLTSQHKFGVTCGPRAQIYCFQCGGFVHHEIFDQERHRITLTEMLPWMAWKEHAVQRSFEALQFLQVRDLGVFWTGMRATYPVLAPREHIAATRLCRDRQIVYHGEIDHLPSHASREAVEATVRQHLALPAERWRIPAPVGMYNLGNTCFMTAILHCLVHCVPLQRYFLRDIGHNHASCAIYRKKGAVRQTAVPVCLGCELDRLFLRYMDSASGRDLSSVVNSISPQSSPNDMEAIRIEKALAQGEPLLTADMLTAAWKCGGMKHLAGYEQRDAHEFLHGFLDILGKHMRDYRMRLINSINTARPDNAFLPKDKVQHDEVKRLFEGTLRSVLMCCECGSKRIQTEPFMSISLPLSKEVDQSRSHESLSVERCLNHFTQPEKLSDPVDCPNCGKKTPTNKQHVVSKLPKILCLHLKRFDSAQNKKIEDFVSFPSTGLNMGRYLPHWCEVSRVPSMKNDAVDEQTTPQVAYDLFATVNHFGSLQSGHYVANVKVKDMWYHCNDSHVVYAGVGNGEAEVLRSEGAYLVFYARR